MLAQNKKCQAGLAVFYDSDIYSGLHGKLAQQQEETTYVIDSYRFPWPGKHGGCFR